MDASTMILVKSEFVFCSAVEVDGSSFEFTDVIIVFESGGSSFTDIPSFPTVLKGSVEGPSSECCCGNSLRALKCIVMVPGEDGPSGKYANASIMTLCVEMRERSSSTASSLKARVLEGFNATSSRI